MHSKEFLALIFNHSQSKYHTYFFFRNTYRHIDALSSFVYIQHCRHHSVGHTSLLHTQDYMCYYTCLHTDQVYILFYSSHCFCHTLFRNNALDIVKDTCFPNTQTYSWYIVQFCCHSLVLYNFQDIENHKQVPSIRFYTHWYSYQSDRREYLCKLSYILNLIQYDAF